VGAVYYRDLVLVASASEPDESWDDMLC